MSEHTYSKGYEVRFDLSISIESGDITIVIESEKGLWDEKVRLRDLGDNGELRVTEGIKRLIEHEAKNHNHYFCKAIVSDGWHNKIT